MMLTIMTSNLRNLLGRVMFNNSCLLRSHCRHILKMSLEVMVRNRWKSPQSMI